MLECALCLAMLAATPAERTATPATSARPMQAHATLADELAVLLARDDAHRKAVLAAVKGIAVRGAPAVVSAAVFGFSGREALRKEGQAIAESIESRLREITAQNGWPGKSLVGETGAITAMELVRRVSEDVPFQRWCLDRIEKARAAGDIPACKTLAQLTDEVLLAEGGKQRYGTALEVDWTTMTYRPRPIEDEAHVEARRAELGLSSLRLELVAFNALLKATRGGNKLSREELREVVRRAVEQAQAHAATPEAEPD